MPKTYAERPRPINLVLTIMFILEMVFKVIGMGLEEYARTASTCSTPRW